VGRKREKKKERRRTAKRTRLLVERVSLSGFLFFLEMIKEKECPSRGRTRQGETLK